MFVVRPRAKVLGVRALDIFAIAVSTERVPGLTVTVVENAGISKVVSDDLNCQRKPKAKQE